VTQGGPAGRQLPDELALHCSACGAITTDPLASRCPDAVPGDDIDHVLVPPDPPASAWPAGDEHDGAARGESPDAPPADPFVRYRRLLYPYRLHRAWGGDDTSYLLLVERLEQRIEALDGRRFHVTPLHAHRAAGLVGARPAPRTVWVKDETGNVSGSHKGRHLFGLALQLAVVAHHRNAAGPSTPPSEPTRLAISSCGNAALAAAVVAAAAEYPLEVFVPPAAAPSVLDRLHRLGATITICHRTPGRTGDPCFAGFLGAVDAGATPFACQGPQHGLTLEGAATLGYELADQLGTAGGRLDRIYLQIGGGAFAAAVTTGLRRAVDGGRLDRLPALVTVQTEAAAPLARAHARAHARAQAAGAGDRSLPEIPVPEIRFSEIMTHLARHRSEAMWPTEQEPLSIAGGILDDETYDWRALLIAMHDSGGHPVVVSESLLAEANERGRAATGIDADATGTAGLAGVLRDAETGALPADAEVAVVFSGARR